MRPTLVAALFMFGPMCWAEQSFLVPEDGIRASYVGSSELPDEIAYAEFLKLLDGTYRQSRHFHFHLVADALGMEFEGAQHRKNRARVRSMAAYFLSAYRGMRLEQLEAKLRILCSDSPASRSAGQLYDWMNTVDDIANTVREKHLIIAVNSLYPAEQKAFLAYLNELKTGITYAKVDSRRMYAPGGNDIRSVARQSCNAFAADYQKLLEVQR